MGQEVESIKRRLVRRDAWHHNYLDDLVDSTLRSMGNRLSNKGPRAQTEFLLEHGWHEDEIVKDVKRVRQLIRDYFKGNVGHKHKRRRNHG